MSDCKISYSCDFINSHLQEKTVLLKILFSRNPNFATVHTTLQLGVAPASPRSNICIYSHRQREI